MTVGARDGSGKHETWGKKGNESAKERENIVSKTKNDEDALQDSRAKLRGERKGRAQNKSQKRVGIFRKAEARNEKPNMYICFS